MSRRDYIRIAADVRSEREKAGRIGWESEEARRAYRVACDAIALNLADTLQADNARFNRSKFLAACGVDGAA